ncbi:CHAD domain-containing protein [Streptomyces sp. NEAU-S77]|uniref:CHAD domain-containing protein n=1 Tax=Streptomyces sp. NEAU-S77 TaxID=3411033 RepID=UPI003BA0E069
MPGAGPGAEGADAPGRAAGAEPSGGAGAPGQGAGAGEREAEDAAGRDGVGDADVAGAEDASAPGGGAGAEPSGGAGAPGRGAVVGGREAAGAAAGHAPARAGRGRTGAEGGRARGTEPSRVRARGGGAEERRTAAHQRAGDPEEARGGALTVGAARAGALLERQLTLARTRAHTAALQALGSSRFHAVADTVALLASEVPLDEATAGRPAEQVLPPLAELANRRLIEAVEALPLGRAGHPYNAEALVHGLAATPAADSPPASDRQDAPWHQVRRLVRMRRYALEVLDLMAARPAATDAEPSQAARLEAAGQALERHRDAAEAAAAAAAAARTPRIAPATAYALGVLHADQRHEVEAARFAFGRIWRRVVGQAS